MRLALPSTKVSLQCGCCFALWWCFEAVEKMEKEKKGAMTPSQLLPTSLLLMLLRLMLMLLTLL